MRRRSPVVRTRAEWGEIGSVHHEVIKFVSRCCDQKVCLRPLTLGFDESQMSLVSATPQTPNLLESIKAGVNIKSLPCKCLFVFCFCFFKNSLLCF